ncbi:MAG: hypothetical protein AAF889_03430 [Cyanobacteria bacterium P01_D01_bin.73]
MVKVYGFSLASLLAMVTMAVLVPGVLGWKVMPNCVELLRAIAQMPPHSRAL